MNVLGQWEQLFAAYGIASEKIPSNPNAVTLTGLAGAPVFRAVHDTQELNDLHAKARALADKMQRLLILGLPLNHPATQTQLPGAIVLPTCRVYGGNCASTFSLSGHKIEPSLLQDLKKETLAVMTNGVQEKTPLLDWLQKLAGKSWPYGTPASLSQLDSLLALVARDTGLIGHIRARQLSFGRGCADAVLLPIKDLVLKNNGLNQTVSPADFRFLSLEHELGNINAARQRIYAQYANKYLTVLNDVDPDFAQMMGSGAQIGSSVLGKTAEKSKTNVPTPDQVMAQV